MKILLAKERQKQKHDASAHFIAPSQQLSVSNYFNFQANIPTYNSFEPLIIEINPMLSTKAKSPL
jgi:hypothetical protein